MTLSDLRRMGRHLVLESTTAYGIRRETASVGSCSLKGSIAWLLQDKVFLWAGTLRPVETYYGKGGPGHVL